MREQLFHAPLTLNEILTKFSQVRQNAVQKSSNHQTVVASKMSHPIALFIYSISIISELKIIKMISVSFLIFCIEEEAKHSRLILHLVSNMILNLKRNSKRKNIRNEGLTLPKFCSKICQQWTRSKVSVQVSKKPR